MGGVGGRSPLTEILKGNNLSIVRLCFSPPFVYKITYQLKILFCPKISAHTHFDSWIKENRCSFGSGFFIRQVREWIGRRGVANFLFLLDTSIDTADFCFVLGNNQVSVGGTVAPLHIMADTFSPQMLNGFHRGFLPYWRPCLRFSASGAVLTETLMTL